LNLQHVAEFALPGSFVLRAPYCYGQIQSQPGHWCTTQNLMTSQVRRRSGTFGEATRDLTDLLKSWSDDTKRLSNEVSNVKRALQAHVDWSSEMADDLAQLKNALRAQVDWSLEDKDCGKYTKGEYMWSPKFELLGIPGLRLAFFPQGDEDAREGHTSVYFYAPAGPKLKVRVTVDETSRAFPELKDFSEGAGWSSFSITKPSFSRVSVEISDIEWQRAGGITQRGLLAVGPLPGSTADWSVDGYDFSDYNQGDYLKSPSFSLLGIPGMTFLFYPRGHESAEEGRSSLYLCAKQGPKMNVKLTVDDNIHETGMCDFSKMCIGSLNVGPSGSKFKRITVEVLSIQRVLVS